MRRFVLAGLVIAGLVGFSACTEQRTPGAVTQEECSGGSNEWGYCEVELFYKGETIDCIAFEATDGATGYTCNFDAYNEEVDDE